MKSIINSLEIIPFHIDSEGCYINSIYTHRTETCSGCTQMYKRIDSRILTGVVAYQQFLNNSLNS